MNPRSLIFSGLSFWLVLIGIGLYFVFPLREKLRFGIDLVGGTYITLEVQTDKAVENALTGVMQGISPKLKRLGKKVPVSKKVENNEVVLAFDNAGNAQAAASALRNDYPEMVQSVAGSTMKLQFTNNKMLQIKGDAVRSNIEVLRTRLDKFSVAEITIAVQGEKNIIIELPDVDDPQQAKEMIGRVAKLEFKLVEKTGSTEDEILYEYDGELPEGKEIIPGRRDHEGRVGTYYLVSKYSDVTGSQIKDARPSLGGSSGTEPIIAFRLSSEGGEKFYELTSRNYGRRLAIILDDVVIIAPAIQSAIRTEGSITGQRSTQEARELANLIKSGAFAAPVTFEEERQIGPSLGAESIRAGLISCLVGLSLLFVFSLYYYSLSGLLAFLALVYNLLLILLGVAWMKATLTLPGIAGMVLTIGMAIDASILIFERIKEELREGASVKNAVNAGFSDAARVILDANITTFIVGVVLYKFGTGPIQGFAVTLMLGIVATLITGLFFLKSLFIFMLDNFNVKKLKI